MTASAVWLRGPTLTTFRLYSGLLEEGMVPPGDVPTYHATLCREADQLTHLVENVLAYARLERGRHAARLVPASFGTLLDQVIAVSGGSEIRVVPDEVLLRFSVEGREAKDVQIDFIAIEPQFAMHGGVESLVPGFFRASRGFAVRLRDVATFDALLAGILKSGAQRVGDVEFRTTSLRTHRDLARQQAVRAAREKAVALAGELGVKVGNSHSIRETSGGGVRHASSGDRDRWAASQNVVQDADGVVAAEGEAEQKLAAGMIGVTSSVQVIFFLERASAEFGPVRRRLDPRSRVR